MIRSPDLDRELENWFAADAERFAPPGLLDTVVARSASVRQRPAALAGITTGTVRERTAASAALRYAWLPAVLALLTLAAAGGALIVGALGITPFTSMPPSGLIAYAAAPAGTDGASPFELHTARADGSGDAIVATAPRIECPTFSPDGSKIAFWATDGGFGDVPFLTVVKTDGSDNRSWPTIAGGGPVAWSPDSNGVAYLAYQHVLVGGRFWSVSELWTHDFGSRTTLQLTHFDRDEPARPVRPGSLGGGAGAPTNPAWSPRGERLAFTVSDYLPTPLWRSVWTVDSDGANLREVDRFPAGELDREVLQTVRWSPDGERLLYARVPGDRSTAHPAEDVFVLDPTSGHARNVTNSGADEVLPAWSPDGRRAAYLVREAGTGYALAIADADADAGSDAIRTTGVSAVAHAWSPDGRHVAVLDAAAAEIVIFDSTTGTRVAAIPTAGRAVLPGCLSWTPAER